MSDITMTALTISVIINFILLLSNIFWIYLNYSNKESLIASIELLSPSKISEIKMVKEPNIYQRLSEFLDQYSRFKKFYQISIGILLRTSKRTVINMGDKKIISGRIKTIGKGNPEIKVFSEFLSPNLKKLIIPKQLKDVDDNTDYSKYNFNRAWFTLERRKTKIVFFKYELTKKRDFQADFRVETSAGNYIMECTFISQ